MLEPSEFSVELETRRRLEKKLLHLAETMPIENFNGHMRRWTGYSYFLTEKIEESHPLLGSLLPNLVFEGWKLDTRSAIFVLKSKTSYFQMRFLLNEKTGHHSKTEWAPIDKKKVENLRLKKD